MILVRFGRFLASWRPGTRLKSFLDAIRFDSTVYEPVATLKTSNRLIFYVFRPPFRPADSSILTDFVAKRFFDEGSDPVRPIPQDPHQNSAQNDVLASSPSFFLDPFVTKTLFCSKPFYLNFVMIFQPPLLLQFSKPHYHEMSWALP